MASMGNDTVVEKKVKIMCFHCNKKVIGAVKCKECNNYFHSTCLQQASRVNRARTAVCKHSSEDVDINPQNDGLTRELTELRSLYDDLHKKYLKLEENFELISDKLDEISTKNKSPQRPLQQVRGRERRVIWQGVLGWLEKTDNPTDQPKTIRNIFCQISPNNSDDVIADGWHLHPMMQLMPKGGLQYVDASCFRNSKSVVFHPRPCEALESLTRFLSSGFVGCVHFARTPNPTPNEIKIIILMYLPKNKAYVGAIPNDQEGFVDRLSKVILQQKAAKLRQSTQPSSQQMGGRERHTIWQGVLEWIYKPKNPTDLQMITRHVPCQVSSNSKDGEPEMKADGWPPKLIMQLIPKQLIGNIGGSYLKNSKYVLFHPTPCEALEALTRIMNSGFAGCVQFTRTPNPTPCDIKVIILLYTVDKKAYLGFIPNDQAAFVDRLRKFIEQQKSTQLRQVFPKFIKNLIKLTMLSETSL